MENKQYNKYDHDYANLYVERTIKKPYTIAKNLKIVDEARQISLNGLNGRFTFCDIGGNINGTVRGGLGDLIETDIGNSTYYPIDLDRYYFLPNQLNNNPRVSFRSAENIRGIVGNGENLPVKDNSTNIVLISDVLEHVNRPHVVLGEAKRVIKPNFGRLFIVSPALYKLDGMKPQFPSLENIDHLIDMNGHINFFNKHILDHLLYNAGFETVKIQGIGFALSLPYLLWIDERFIPRNYFDPKSKEEKIYREIADVIGNLTADIVSDIDKNLNNQENYKSFYNGLIFNGDQDVLSGIYEVLRYSSFFGENSIVDESYVKLRNLIENTKIYFQNTNMKNKLKQYIDVNGYEFLANSVLIVAK